MHLFDTKCVSIDRKDEMLKRKTEWEDAYAYFECDSMDDACFGSRSMLILKCKIAKITMTMHFVCQKCVEMCLNVCHSYSSMSKQFPHKWSFVLTNVRCNP